MEERIEPVAPSVVEAPAPEPTPPKPAKRKPAEVLAEKLLATLESQGRPGSPEFPLTAARLIELSDGADEKLVKKALASPTVADRVVLAVRKNRQSPLALRQDVEALAASPRLLDFALHLVC